MIKKNSFFLFICLLLGSNYVQAASSIEQLLPANSVKGTVSILNFDPKIEQVTSKFIEAIKQNPEWIKKIMSSKQVKEGEPLSYHPNLGMTKEEYKLFLSAAKTTKLAPLEKVTIQVENIRTYKRVSISGSRFKFSFAYDTLNNMIRTSKAALIADTSIDQNDVNSPLGAWSGEQWKARDKTKGFQEKIAIGKKDKENTAIIYYDLRSPEDNAFTYFVVEYPI